jgi:hypothetical protein
MDLLTFQGGPIYRSAIQKNTRQLRVSSRVFRSKKGNEKRINRLIHFKTAVFNSGI